MKKIFALFLVVILSYFNSATINLANPSEKVIITAEKPDALYLESEINKRVLKKYIPVKLTIKNKSDKEISLSDKVFFIKINGQETKAPSSNLVYENTKRHSVRRTFLIGIPVTILSFGFLAVPAFVGIPALSATANGNLQDNINKVKYKPRHLYDNDSLSGYVFIPKKEKNISSIIIKDAGYGDDETFDLKVNLELKKL